MPPLRALLCSIPLKLVPVRATPPVIGVHTMNRLVEKFRLRRCSCSEADHHSRVYFRDTGRLFPARVAVWP